MTEKNKLCVHDFHEVEHDSSNGWARVVCAYCGQVRLLEREGKVLVEIREGEVKQ